MVPSLDAARRKQEELHIIWFSEVEYGSGDTNRLSRAQWVAESVGQVKPDYVMYTGDGVQGSSSTSPDRTVDRTSWLAVWDSIISPKELVLGNRDLEDYTVTEWETFLGYTSRPQVLGSRVNGEFTIKKGKIKIRVITLGYDVTDAVPARTYIQSIIESSVGYSAVLIFTHSGSATYSFIDTAVNAARATSGVPVYHFFCHHHPLVPFAGEWKEVLYASFGIQYTAPKLRGFITAGMRDGQMGRYANIYISDKGEIRLDTVVDYRHPVYSGEPTAGQTPLYWYGAESVPWVPGESVAGGLQVKHSDYMYAEVGETAVARKAWVTDVAVDLASVNTVYVDWDLIGSGSFSADGIGENLIIASTTKMGNHLVYDAIINLQGEYVRQVTALDVSALSGLYYIRVHAKDGSGSGTRKAVQKVCRVWLE